MNEQSAVPPSVAHRVLSLVAVAALLMSVESPWRAVAAKHPIAGLAVGSMYVVLLALAVGVLCVRTRRALTRLDAGALVSAVLIAAVGVRAAFEGKSGYNVDEGSLTHHAARAIASGHNPYTSTWTIHAGPTLLFNGHYADGFGYPPLAPILGAVVSKLAPFANETTLVAFLGLVASGVLTFWLVPVGLRPLAVLAVFVVSPLSGAAAQGYPLAVTMPFLLVAVWRWPSIGASGRLGRRGVLQAVALGLAASGQQLVWFLIPFLAVMLWRLREAHLPGRPALALVGRYLGVALAAFAVVDAPFALADPGAWLRGITGPLRQHAFFSGPGLANVSLRDLSGSGALEFYSFAALALYLTLLLTLALFPSRLGPAAVIVPFVVFWLSVRSQSMYYGSLVPAVFVSVAGALPAAFAGAVPVVSRETVRRVVPAAGAVATAALVAVAVLTPSPLSLRDARLAVKRAKHGVPALSSISVTVVNSSSESLTPHFVTDRRSKVSLFWRVIKGPGVIGPHRTATYLLHSPLKQGGFPTTRLWVLTDGPQTIRRTRLTVQR